MSTASPAPKTPVVITHNSTLNRFEATVEGRLCVLDYLPQGIVLRVHHTGVPTELEGRGIASALVQAAVDHARSNGLQIVPQCSYVQVWMKRHPEYADLIAR
jgi:hypothetical protein